MPPGGVNDLPVNSIVTRLLDIRNKFTAAPTQAQGQAQGQGEPVAAASADI